MLEGKDIEFKGLKISEIHDSMTSGFAQAKCYRADLFLLFISIVGHFVTYCENIEYLVFKGFLVHGDTILNCHVAPTFMFHLSSELKERLSDEIYPILHEWYIGNSYYEDDHQWSNQGELVLTSIYGIRRYTNGSSLGMHVDTANSHVISGIINVNQEDVAKPWQLVILDHDGKEHSVVIQPGDMLMYESARLLHGRPEPFFGSYYDNVFIHYKPDVNIVPWDYSWI